MKNLMHIFDIILISIFILLIFSIGAFILYSVYMSLGVWGALGVTFSALCFVRLWLFIEGYSFIKIDKDL